MSESLNKIVIKVNLFLDVIYVNVLKTIFVCKLKARETHF